MRAFTIVATLGALSAAQNTTTADDDAVKERTYAPKRYGNFNYSAGGADWGTLYESMDNNECSVEQLGGSPINIPTSGKYVTESTKLGHKFYSFAKTSLSQWYKGAAEDDEMQAAVDMRVHMMTPEAQQVLSMGHTSEWMEKQNKKKQEIKKEDTACKQKVKTQKAADDEKCEAEFTACTNDAVDCEKDKTSCLEKASDNQKEAGGVCEDERIYALDSAYPRPDDPANYDENDQYSEAVRKEVAAWQDVAVAVVDDTLEKEHKQEEDLGPNEVGTHGYGVLPTDIRIHTPAEHQIDSVKYDAELQIYGKELRGCGCDGENVYETFVTSILFQEDGGSNELIDAILNLWTESKKDVVDREDGLDLGDLLPESTGDFYHYIGSLTTPPCTSGVAWYVLAETQSISKTQLDKLREYTTSYSPDAAQALASSLDSTADPANANSANGGTAGNNRQIQPMEGARQVYRSVVAKSGASALYTGAAATLAVITALAF